MSFACAYLCLCTMFIHSACKIQKSMVDLLELELAISCHIGADNPSHSEAASALNHGVSSINDQFLYTCIPFSGIWCFKLGFLFVFFF